MPTRIYSTEEERMAARRASYAKYNQAHKAERAAHNKAYVQRPDVKAKRRETYLRKASNRDNTTQTQLNIVPRDAETVLVNS